MAAPPLHCSGSIKWIFLCLRGLVVHGGCLGMCALLNVTFGCLKARPKSLSSTHSQDWATSLCLLTLCIFQDTKRIKTTHHPASNKHDKWIRNELWVQSWKQSLYRLGCDTKEHNTSVFAHHINAAVSKRCVSKGGTFHFWRWLSNSLSYSKT